jgi:hypothetical protein
LFALSSLYPSEVQTQPGIPLGVTLDQWPPRAFADKKNALWATFQKQVMMTCFRLFKTVINSPDWMSKFALNPLLGLSF